MRRPAAPLFVLTIAASVLFALPAAPAEGADPPAAGDLEWIRLGGPLGGLGYDVRMRPDDPDVMLVTDAFSGLFMSTDGGGSWFPSSDGITVRTGPTGEAIPVFCATIDPNDPAVVWAGTQHLGGLFRSTDGGSTWERRDQGVVESEGITFRGVAIDPRDSDVVWAAAEVSSWVWAGEERQGRGFDMVQGVVYRTENAGASWDPVWRGDNLARYIWIDPTDSDTVYVSTGIFDREAANSDPEAGTPGGEGVVKTTDGGRTWTRMNAGLGNLYIGSLFMHPEDPQTLLAAAGHNVYPDGGGVYLTTNGGERWSPVLSLAPEPIGFHSVEFVVGHPEIAYAASDAGVWRSFDRGNSWLRMTPFDTDWGPAAIRGGFPIDIQADPRNPDRLFINAYGGGNFVSVDGGVTFSAASAGYTGAQTRDVIVDPAAPGRVWAAARSGFFTSADGGETWEGLSPFGTWPTFENMVAAIAADGSILEADNVERGIAFGLGRAFGYRSLGLEFRQSVRALAFAPSDPAIAYAGVGGFFTPSLFDDSWQGGGIYRSDDGGASWQEANDDLSAGAHVTGLAVDPLDPDRVLATTTNQGLLASSDGGSSWATLADPGTALHAVAIHPSDPEMVLIGSRGIFRSEDGGVTRTRTDAGLMPESVVLDFEFDPMAPDVVYAADVGSGVYRSVDGGRSWEAINTGLRTRAVNALAISADAAHIYAATEGDGVYRLDLGGAPPPAAATPDPPGTTTVAPTPAPTTAGAAAAVPDTTEAVTAPAETTTTGAGAAAPAGDDDRPIALWVGAGALLVLVAGAGFWAGRRRARR